MRVIRKALKWLISLLCGRAITTTGVTEVHHIRHPSGDCAVMRYRLLLLNILRSNNDESKWDIISPEQHASVGLSINLFIHVCVLLRPKTFSDM